MPSIHTQPCTKHLYTLTGRCIFLLKPAHLLAPTEDTEMRITDSKQIKKGDVVAMLSRTNKHGVFSVSRWTVAAAGKKKILLNREDGTMLGYQICASLLPINNTNFRLLTVENFEADVAELACAFNAQEIARMEHLIEKNSHLALYCESMERDLVEQRNLRIEYRNL